MYPNTPVTGRYVLLLFTESSLWVERRGKRGVGGGGGGGGEKKERQCSSDFMKYTFSIVMCRDTSKLICLQTW